MRLHPATRLLIALLYLILVIILPLKYQGGLIIIGALIAFSTKPLPSQDPGRAFLRLWLTAGFFLFLIHCISWNGSLLFKSNGVELTSKSFFRIGSLMVAFLWLIRTVKTEELYAMLIALRLPIPAIYILFQTVFLIPRFGERAQEILLAQEARGFELKGIRSRLKAYILILAPLFATMFYELEQNAAAMSAKGLHAPGTKTSLTQINITRLDATLIALSLAATLILLLSVR